MIYIVNSENRSAFGEALRQMHRHRKLVFVDRLRWSMPVSGDLEIDAYDRPDTVYLIAMRTRSEPVLASARLLPTTGPHLMGDLFAHACAAGPPSGPTIWEASRFCVSPAIVHRSHRLKLLWEILCGIMETCLLFGVERIIFTSNDALLPLVMRCGWEAALLGPTVTDASGGVTAVQVHITPGGLCAMRERFEIACPITRFPSADLSAAA